MINEINLSLTWKDVLADKMVPELAEEIDHFETQMELRRQGKVDEKVFAELRLRRGAYGQRYDNGRRHDGEKSQEISFFGGVRCTLVITSMKLKSWQLEDVVKCADRSSAKSGINIRRFRASQKASECSPAV